MKKSRTERFLSNNCRRMMKKKRRLIRRVYKEHDDAIIEALMAEIDELKTEVERGL